MQRHAHFDLWLHVDGELGAVLGSAVVERHTIHEWPLSCVQRVRTEDGRSHIYKVQAPPTVEPEFYARARSPLLVATRVLPARGTTAAMVMDEVVAPRLSDAPPSTSEALAAAAGLVARIAEIEGDLPFLADISTPARWAEYIGSALDDIRACIAEGTFHHVDMAMVEDLDRWSEGPSVRAAVAGPAGYVHGDLMAANVLAAPDGYRVLDWQRPLRGPTALDVATLLISLGPETARLVPPGDVRLHHLLRVAWYAQSARRWLPDGRPHLDEVIAHIAGALRSLA